MDVLNFEDCRNISDKTPIEEEVVMGISLALEELDLKDGSAMQVPNNLARKIADPTYRLQDGDNADRTLYNLFHALNDFQLGITHIKICECVHFTYRLGLLDCNPYDDDVAKELRILPLRMAGTKAYTKVRSFLKPYFERISLPEPEVIPDWQIFAAMVNEYYFTQYLETWGVVDRHIIKEVARNYFVARPALYRALVNDWDLRERIISSIADFRHLSGWPVPRNQE